MEDGDWGLMVFLIRNVSVFAAIPLHQGLPTSFPLWISHPKRKLYLFFSVVKLYKTKLNNSLFYILKSEDKQKKKSQQKDKSSPGGGSTLQRSKTFVNLLFKRDRKGRSKSPSRPTDRGEDTQRSQESNNTPEGIHSKHEWSRWGIEPLTPAG